jgi:hypothetical protein
MAVKKTTEKAEWTYNGAVINKIEQFPGKSIGFIYLIENLTNGKMYYGRKTCRAMSKKKRLTQTEKKLPENSRKTFKYVEHEYKGWQDYCGSCEPLLEDIKKGDKYRKSIVKFCETKGQLTAQEIKFIVCECITQDNCYNGNILGKIFKKDFI